MASDPLEILDAVMGNSTVCLLTRRIGANVYVRYNHDRDTLEWCSTAGPAVTVMMYETTSYAEVADMLDTERARRATYPLRYDETPFPKIPAMADEYEQRSYTLYEAYRVVCECGDVGMAYPARRHARRWGQDHAEECGEAWEIEELGPDDRELEV